MDKINIDYFTKEYNALQLYNDNDFINNLRKEGFTTFNKTGVPTTRNEEWRFTTISNLFNKEYSVTGEILSFTSADIAAAKLPNHEKATELVFINGIFNKDLSSIRFANDEAEVMSLEDAANSDFYYIIKKHLGKSSAVIKDGIHALNTSFIHGGVFLLIKKKKTLEHPVCVYHYTNTENNHVLAQPRSLVFIEEGAKLQLIESYITQGAMDSFTNEVMEVVVSERAIFEYYKIQNDSSNASQVNTTHIRHVGKCYSHAVTISLSGGMIRNNTNVIMEAEGNEAHLYGLYLLNNKTHIDNHTLVDNTKPNCFSNELYKGILNDSSSGVFSGKIFVRPDAQKTNAYQSNKNILLSDDATINTKPQLEIFADDVKCSHGCTVGQLDEEALFYLRARGISREHAQAMLLKAFAEDVVNQVKYEPLKNYIEQLITDRLAID